MFSFYCYNVKRQIDNNRKRRDKRPADVDLLIVSDHLLHPGICCNHWYDLPDPDPHQRFDHYDQYQHQHQFHHQHQYPFASGIEEFQWRRMTEKKNSKVEPAARLMSLIFFIVIVIGCHWSFCYCYCYWC